MKKIGIMGGTFNPIHVGHILSAQYALEAKKLDEIWFIPTGHSYMKSQKEVLSPQVRLKMTMLALEDIDNMKCLDIEVKRTGYTYSYQTFEILKQDYPENEFYFIMGADCLFQIETWKYPEKIFDIVKVLVLVRNGFSNKDICNKIAFLNEKFGNRIEQVEFPVLEISSTEVRTRISQGKSVRFFVPDRVIKYIEDNDLYKNLK